MLNFNYLSLYLILEPSLYRDHEELLNATKIAIKHGVTAIQLRYEHETDKKAWYELALKLKELLYLKNIPLIINDHIDIALAVDAEGVHLGQKDIPVEIARKLLGKNKIIGLSISSRDELSRVPTDIINYLGIGPIYPTNTKRDANNAIGIDQLITLVKQKLLPAVAIGGINITNIEPILKTGIEGVAVVSAICGQQNVIHATQQLSNIIKEIRL